MLIPTNGELADSLIHHGIAIIIIIVIYWVARCNDRTRRPFPGAQPLL